MILGCDGDPGSPGANRLPDDLQPPTIEIIQPLTGKDFYDSVTLEALAIDDKSVALVEFLIDGRLTSDELSMDLPPWQVRWDCSQLALGRHSLQARVFDEAGKEGLSRVILFNKEHVDSLPRLDTLRYFAQKEEEDYNPPSDGYIAWQLPPRDEVVRAVGVRFSPDRPCKLKRIYVRIYWDLYLQFDQARVQTSVYSVLDGKPDSLLKTDTHLYRQPLDEIATVNAWKSTSNRAWNVDIEGEFIVVFDRPEEFGDSLAIMTDSGLWNNQHGLVLEGNEWRVFHSGARSAFNPLIYAVVEYAEP